MAKLDEKIGFIGGGNMAFAIGSGLINRGIVKSSQVLVSGPNLNNLDKWRDIGADTTTDNGEVRVFVVQIVPIFDRIYSEILWFRPCPVRK